MAVVRTIEDRPNAKGEIEPHVVSQFHSGGRMSELVVPFRGQGMATDLYLGTNSPRYPSSFRFRGAVDELRIYDRAMSQDEIGLLAKASSSESSADVERETDPGAKAAPPTAGTSPLDAPSRINPAVLPDSPDSVSLPGVDDNRSAGSPSVENSAPTDIEDGSNSPSLPQDQRAQADPVVRQDLSPVSEAPSAGQIETDEKLEEFEEATKPDDWSISIDYPRNGSHLANKNIEVSYEITKTGDSFLGGTPFVQIFSAGGEKLASDDSTAREIETSTVDIQDNATGTLIFAPPELAFGQEGTRDLHFMVALYDPASGERLVDANNDNNFELGRVSIVQVDWRIKQIRLLREPDDFIYPGDTLQFEVFTEANDPLQAIPEARLEARYQTSFFGNSDAGEWVGTYRVQIGRSYTSTIVQMRTDFELTLPDSRLIDFSEGALQRDVVLELKLQDLYENIAIGDANSSNDEIEVSFKITRANDNQTVSIDTANLTKIELPSDSPYSKERTELIGSGALLTAISLEGACLFWFTDSSGGLDFHSIKPNGCVLGDRPSTVGVHIPENGAIVGMRVCRHGYDRQLDGIEVQVASVRPDASLDQAVTTVKEDRKGCDDWTRYAKCPSGQAAGGIEVVHHRDGSDDPQMHSLNLLCGAVQVSQGT